jgi:DNA polymerase III delta prime subunit
MKHNFSTLTPTKATKYIYNVLKSPRTARTRVLMHGDPGVGKSRIAKAVAKLLRAELIDIRLLQLDLGALRGLERIVDMPDGSTETHPSRPYFLPEYVADEDITEDTPRHLILLDEIGAADDSIRKAAFEMLTDHRIGPHKLGKNVWVIGATNSSEDGTNVYEFDRATRDRFNHIMVETEAEGLAQYAIDNEWHYHVVSAIKNNGDIITATAEDLANSVMASSSPRSLESVSEALYARDEGDMDDDDFDVFVKGMIGHWAAQYILDRIYDESAQFDLEKLVKARPEDREYPESEFGTFSLVGALSAYAKDAERLDKSLDIVLGMPNDLNTIVEEAKTTFIYQIGDRLGKWQLFSKYAVDPRMTPFLKDTKDITDQADQAYADRNQRRAA